VIGTLINTGAIIVGSLLGVLIGKRFSNKLKDTVVTGLGLFTLGYGIISFFETTNALIPLGGLLIGALLGEWWKIEEGLNKIGDLLKKTFIQKKDEEDRQPKFIEGFVTASLVFVIGPMAILGSLQDGLTGNYEMLAIKSILDGFAAIAFASSLGLGVIFSAVSVLVYQGLITSLSGFSSAYFSDLMMTEMTAVGGLILMAIAISSLLAIKKIRTGSFLPALLVTPMIVLILEKILGN
jgi:uncharacterized membrane protein YqgA involved in biofilm formation